MAKQLMISPGETCELKSIQKQRIRAGRRRERVATPDCPSQKEIQEPV
ncbi:MAG: hypothetical protein M1294_11285 [Firmicutes bacterium]|nr:hypothetical protein [Bacillota bacterium]